MKFALWITTIVAFLAVYCVFHADGAGGEGQGAGASGSVPKAADKGKGILRSEDQANVQNNADKIAKEKSKRMCNYFRMLALRDMAIPVLLNIFRERWKILLQHEWWKTCSVNWVDGHECGEELMNIFTENEIRINGPKEIISDGDTTKWDVTSVTIAIWAISESIGYYVHHKELNINRAQYNNEDLHIGKIQHVRNKISHSPISELTDAEFEPLWKDMTSALTGLRVTKMEIEKKIMEFNENIKGMDMTMTTPPIRIEEVNFVELVDEQNHTVTRETYNAEILRKWMALYDFGVAHSDMIKTIDFSSPIRAQSKAEQIKTKANEAFNAGKHSEAINYYTSILLIDGLSNDFLAVIFSNRSAAYLHLDDNSIDDRNLSKAIFDAKLAVQMRPTWWRGYQRLGMAYKSKGKLEKALEQLETALALDPPEDAKRTLQEEVKIAKEGLEKYSFKHGKIQSLWRNGGDSLQ